MLRDAPFAFLRGLPVLLGRRQLFLSRSLDLRSDKAPGQPTDGHGEPEPSALPSLVPRRIDVGNPACRDPDGSGAIRFMKGGCMALFARTPSYLHSRPLGCHETEYAEKFRGETSLQGDGLSLPSKGLGRSSVNVAVSCVAIQRGRLN